ncbi:Coenzyme F420 hydrogenase/dehydrogenase, beta subunit C-terminal domain [Segatella copri]|uniref:Coenzyme F420 hydrogenase/dehydrogenase, beta subunit C-terminal domain n=1 Tax=Segatella copri TaxID=165179 RepID=UPI002FF3E596
MINIAVKSKCTGCSACVQKCPKQCISFEEDREGFKYPKVKLSVCIDCGLCEKVCPVLQQDKPRNPVIVYAAKNSNLSTRLASSSGGIFALLAETILRQNGVVFGARFDNEWNVIHDYTESLDGLSVFLGSRYVQSKIGNTYKYAERFLKEGRKVLFSGTPCQIVGLKKYLRKDYDTLLTVDFVCHGVPSPMIWRGYLNEKIRPLGVDGRNMVSQLSLKDLPVITGISFRDKRYGWKKYGFSVRAKSASKADKNLVSQSVEVTDKTLLYEPHKANLYMKGFLKNLYLRPSCYACPAKCGKSGADYTLADFWGASTYVGDFDDDKGLSAVLVYKNKVNIESLDMAFKVVGLNDILSQNPAVIKSSRMKGGRDRFFQHYNREHQIDLINRYSKYTIKENIRYTAIKLLVSLHLAKFIKKIIRK